MISPSLAFHFANGTIVINAFREKDSFLLHLVSHSSTNTIWVNKTELLELAKQIEMLLQKESE